MVFGSTNGSGLGGLKSALGNEGAISERARLAHIKAEHDRVEKEKSKLSLEEKKKKLDHNKRELSQRTIEVRRIVSEIVHAESMLQSIEREMKAMDAQVGQLNAKYNDLMFQTNDHKKKMDLHRDQLVKENQAEQHLQQEIRALELKMVREKDEIARISKEMDTMSVQISRLTNDANKVQADIHRSNSQKQYKSKEIEARKRAVSTLSEKKMHEISEMRRLESENARLESEIKSLERLTHN
ncbi:MAG: hypothetical protein RIQ72_650 [Candidatus Parcubacteria bacterium]|jgi:chromosome segregation ATPase